MKVKIIKPYEYRQGKSWQIGQIAEVTNEFGQYLMKEKLANEIRVETRKTDDGKDFSVEVEVLDKSAKRILKNVDEEKKE